MSDSPTRAQWQKYLRYDPTRWLLETNDPSILLWYQLDIAHRPEDARAVIETRERVLYSEPVQTIFAKQDNLGYWGDAVNLAQPYYNATVWNLALLAELGIPRTSRRARSACEFVLQNFLQDDETFAGLNDIETGYLLRGLGYFNYANDARVLRAARALSERANSFEGHVAALWGCRASSHDADIARGAQHNLKHTLETLGNERGFVPHTAMDGDAAARVPYTFPQFDPRDELFVLRVLTEYDRVKDTRATPLIERLIAKQNERAQWTLERDLNAQLLTRFETENAPSRWLTLNALRVITQLVLHAQ